MLSHCSTVPTYTSMSSIPSFSALRYMHSPKAMPIMSAFTLVHIYSSYLLRNDHLRLRLSIHSPHSRLKPPLSSPRYFVSSIFSRQHSLSSDYLPRAFGQVEGAKRGARVNDDLYCLLLWRILGFKTGSIVGGMEPGRSFMAKGRSPIWRHLRRQISLTGPWYETVTMISHRMQSLLDDAWLKEHCLEAPQRSSFAKIGASHYQLNLGLSSSE